MGKTHTLDRRALMTGTAATAAALAATTIPAPAASTESALPALIEAHKKANAEWLKTVEAEDKASSIAMDQDRSDPILAEVFPGKHVEIDTHTNLTLEIYAKHDEARTKKANGYEAANRAYRVAREADHQAAWAILEHPCRTMEENRIRAEYLLQETRDAPGKDLRYSMEADADMLEAFIRSTAGMEAEA